MGQRRIRIQDSGVRGQIGSAYIYHRKYKDWNWIGCAPQWFIFLTFYLILLLLPLPGMLNLLSFSIERARIPHVSFTLSSRTPHLHFLQEPIFPAGMFITCLLARGMCTFNLVLFFFPFKLFIFTSYPNLSVKSRK